MTAHPLSGHSHGFLTLLGKAGLIEQQTGILISTQQRVGIPSHLIHHGARVPWRVGQEVVQRLGIGVRNDFGHTLNVTPWRLEQPAQVPAGLMAGIASPQAKERRIFLAERQESLTQSFQGRWGMAFLLAITNLSGVASATTLDRVLSCHIMPTKYPGIKRFWNLTR